MNSKLKWNVLVFPGGTENGLEIQKSLRYAKEAQLFSASSCIKNHAEFVYKNHFIIPDVYDPNCLEELNAVINKNQINYLFPANSIVIDFLVENRKSINCPIILPNNEIVKLIRSKKRTYQFFSGIIKVPQIYNVYPPSDAYPIFVKPDNSYGSKGTRKIENDAELKSLNLDFEEYLLCEYLPGDEFTVECFSTLQEGVIYCSARTRERIRMGTSMRSEKAGIDVQSMCLEIAKKIFNKIKIDGLWFFQLKKNKSNELCLLEVESRVAGTMAYSRVNGVNLPLANLYLAAGENIKLTTQNYDVIIDRSLANHYSTNLKYDTVYIDLDDTILNKGRINTDIIKFLFQCVNEKKKLILLTKTHEKNKDEFLKSKRIYQIFDEIFYLGENEKKSDYITSRNSIFIEDSFTQRKEVEKRIGIPTFEPNMIELLLDERHY